MEQPLRFSKPITDPVKQDLRDSQLWKEINNHLKSLFDPAIDQVSAASDLTISPDGRTIAFTGAIHNSDWRESPSSSRICTISVDCNRPAESLKVVTAGPHDNRLPKWSPDLHRQTLAFLSDRDEKGIFKLFLMGIGQATEPAPFLKQAEGSIEDFHWSSDGTKILIQAAGRMADKGDAGGSGKIGKPKEGLPKWMPTVDSGDTDDVWRSVWVYDLKTGKVENQSHQNYNPWEVAWCNSDAFVAIVSDSPVEDAWYTTSLYFQKLDRNGKTIYIPESKKRQLGCPVSSPSGNKVAIITALCSDRGLVAGEIKVIDVGTSQVQELQTPTIDVVHLVWKTENCLFFMGLQGLNIVSGEITLDGKMEIIWVSTESSGSMYPTPTLFPDGRFATVLQSWKKPPEITSDGLELQGHLILPKIQPHKKVPLLVAVHGGPTYLWLNTAPGAGLSSVLSSRGYAIFRPNPRGSAGRGQRFAEAVLGDMGGQDAQDIISGIAAVCEAESTIDPGKIGVFGGSYGGFMASLLPTLTPIFRASVSLSAVTDWHSFHTTSNIPSFDKLYLHADPFDNNGGRYLELSPVMTAGKYKTPVLQIAGDNDLAVPYSQAVQYHRTLIEKGVESAVVIYPGEGHGVSNYPAGIDVIVRTVGWFEKYIPN